MLNPANPLSCRYRWLEPMLVAAVLSVTLVLWRLAVADHVLVHLYYVPVVLTGFFLGQYRARMMAMLCVLTATIIFVPYLDDPLSVPPVTLLGFLLWASTLMLIAFMVGRLSDGWRSSMEALREEHRRDVLTDPLTGVANRRAYEFELTRRLFDWRRNAVPLSLVLVDIDYFKKFNDRYGHQAGDLVLQSVARELTNAVRDADLVARYGGEEFGVVMTGITAAGAQEAAERIRGLIEASRFPFNGMILKLTVSVGVAHALPGEEVSELVQRADTALYSSKQAGRNCAHFHDGHACQKYGDGMATEAIAQVQDSVGAAKPSDHYTDEVTGLPAQKVFLEELRRRTAERRRYGVPLSLAIVSFDTQQRSVLEDRHAMNSLLATVSKLAGSVLRDTDLIARYSENSFGLLMPMTPLESVMTPLERLCEGAENYSDARFTGLDYSVTIGATEVGPDERAGAALQRAQRALSQAADNSVKLVGLDTVRKTPPRWTRHRRSSAVRVSG